MITATANTVWAIIGFMLKLSTIIGNAIILINKYDKWNVKNLTYSFLKFPDVLNTRYLLLIYEKVMQINWLINNIFMYPKSAAGNSKYKIG